MLGKEISIDSCHGSAVDYSKDSLIELVALGYEFNLEKSGLIFQSQIEYQPADIVYFAKSNGNEVGSLSLKIRPNSGNDQFWNNLQTTMLDLTDPSLLACYIHGIVVHPKYRREGIARRLLEKMIEEYSPEVILGQTKSPTAVLVRSKILNQYGYRTFYGFSEVTPESDAKKEYEGQDSARLNSNPIVY